MKTIRSRFFYYDGALCIAGSVLAVYYNQGAFWFRLFGCGLYYSLHRNEFKILLWGNRSI